MRGGFLVFLVKRFCGGLLVLLIVATAVFLLARTLGDPATLLLPDTATAADAARLRQALGLSEPLYVQYARFIWGLLSGDWGQSIRLRGYHVSDLVLTAFGNSARLATLAMLFGVVGGVPLGVLTAVRRGGLVDIGARFIAICGQNTPSWFMGIVLILIFSVGWNVLPASGMDDFANYIMPAFVLSLIVLAPVLRLTRSSMLEVLDSDYVKLARAKGLPGHIVLWKHALRNALIAPLTYAGVYFATLITSAVVVEVVFAWPGLGRTLFDALNQRDYPVLQGAIVLGAAAVVGFNFLVDLLYVLIDPRIRLGQASPQ